MLRSFLKLVIILLIFAAFLTPPVYSLLQLWLGPNIWPFSRVYDRVALFVLIVALYLMRKEFRLKDLSSDLPLFKESHKLSRFLSGFALSLIPVMIIVPIMVANGNLHWRPDTFSYYFWKFVSLIPTIVVVSFLEELIFRVFIFWTLYKSFGLVKAMVMSSVFYAVVHFIAPVKTFTYNSFDLLAGFKYYYVVGERILSFDLLSALIVMLVIGLFLSFALSRKRSMFLCAGLHGGWIAAIKLTKFSTIIPVAGVSALSERYYLLTFPFTWLAILATIVLTSAIYLKPTAGKNLKDN